MISGISPKDVKSSSVTVRKINPWAIVPPQSGQSSFSHDVKMRVIAMIIVGINTAIFFVLNLH